MHTKSASASKSQVPALSRALKVLEALTEDPYEMNLTELSEQLKIPSASLWRIMKVLTENEYVIFDKKRHTYRIGFKLIKMGNVILSGSHLRSQAREYLKKLAEMTGETIELDVRIRDQLVLIDQFTGANAVYLYSHPGSVMPYFHATAPGKIYLAQMESDKLRNAMDRLGFPKLTDHTIQNMFDLETELEKVRTDGYAKDIEEMRDGVARVAAPIYDQGNKLIACLAIACPAFRLKEQNRTNEYAAKVKQIAEKITKNIGKI